MSPPSRQPTCLDISVSCSLDESVSHLQTTACFCFNFTYRHVCTKQTARTKHISHLDTERQQRRKGTGVGCARYDMKVLVTLFELCMIVLRFDTDIGFTNAWKKSI